MLRLEDLFDRDPSEPNLLALQEAWVGLRNLLMIEEGFGGKRQGLNRFGRGIRIKNISTLQLRSIGRRRLFTRSKVLMGIG